MSDTYYDDVSLLIPMIGENEGTVFKDYSPRPKAVYNRYGYSQTLTDFSKFYGSSGFITGYQGYVGIDEVLVAATTTDLTFETWIWDPGYAEDYCLFLLGNNNFADTGFKLTLLSDKTLNVYSEDSEVFTLTTTATVPAETWTHISVCRASGAWHTSIGGTIDAATFTSNHACNATRNRIGLNATNGEQFPGRYQDLRITENVARYTSSFTPPGQMIKTVSGTVLDINGDPCQRTIIAVPRNYPGGNAFYTQSDAGDGSYSLLVPDTEVSRIVLADETALYNDIVDRVIPG